ncbi:hypothetical protein [Nostoc sp. CCY0012]|uniref:hypothetical protein n=1 Tax=Nostoc sp. CCY0012 TaxID=1056123 RepID=UPI0039C655DA
MGITDAENRSSKKRESGDIRNSQSNTRIMGSTSPDGCQSGNDKIRISGENRQQTNTFGFGEGTENRISGKIVRQLIKETERQLAYHKIQASELETRLNELHELTEDLDKEE